MPIATHTKAAVDHESVVKAHRSAAELHEAGNHPAAVEKSTKAKCCCDVAEKSSVDAHSKSLMQGKK